MKFYSVNEFESNIATIYEEIHSDGGAVIMSGDKPEFLMLDVGGFNDYEAVIKAMSRAKALAALESMQRISVNNGNVNMTDEEIEAEIQAARRERRNRENRN